MPEQSKRYQTLPIGKIDEEYIGREISDTWRTVNDNRESMLAKREEYTLDWRDLLKQRTEGPWDDSSHFSHPITLSMGKAIHARLWSLFSDFTRFFGVKAKKAAFQDREETIRLFMTWILEEYANNKQGTKDVFDSWLWQVVFDGADYLKLGWMIEEHEFIDVVPQLNRSEKTTFDPRNQVGRTEVSATLVEEERVSTEIVETPFISRINLEDFLMPLGQDNPQTSDWVAHRVFLTPQQMKERADQKKFDRDAVDFALKHQHVMRNGNEDEIKNMRAELDGWDVQDGHSEEGKHAVIEYYGKFYVESKHDDRADEKIDKKQQELVVWVHFATRKILGWTYLWRVSPAGIRPLFRGDYIRFPDRSHGVGVAEALTQIKQSIDAVYNLRQDAGVLASTPTGAYKPSTGLKPDKLKLHPGELIPVDDPRNDIEIFNFPFFGNYGYQEEDRLNAYAERLLNVNDLTLGRTPTNVGVFRTASGANDFQTATGVQVEIHFDRLARTLKQLFQALFRLVRARMPETLYFRVTGERGEPIFGKVNKDDLKGEYDFEINVDAVSQSRVEAQQKAALVLSTLLNPAYLETGIVNTDNLYNITKNFLIQNRVRRIDNFITKPARYQGEVVTPSERLHRIMVGNFMEPPIENTVRLDENHEDALRIYQGFKDSDMYGLFGPEQIQGLERVIQKHEQFQAAIQGGGLINRTGTQLPREGLEALPAAGPQAIEQGALGAPQGEANGPIF